MNPKHKITVGLVQQKGYLDKEASLDDTIAGVREAAKQGAALVLLQELHTGLYFCQREDYAYFALAEEIPGPTSKRLGALAKELGIVIVGSLFEKRAPGIYHNTAVVFEKEGSIVGKYRKMHIPDDPGFYEKFYFTPGDLGFTPINTSVGRLGVLVCWDQWYPEAARLMALAGAQLLLYPTAIGWIPAHEKEEQNRQLEAWVVIQRAHAVANGLPVLVCNRVGFESAEVSFATQQSNRRELGIQFWGTSFIAGQQGEMLAKASIDQPQVLIGEIDIAHNEQVRQRWPYFRDRRIDAYQGLLSRYLD
jgi:N-carbamoylputrescine amidase